MEDEVAGVGGVEVKAGGDAADEGVIRAKEQYLIGNIIYISKE